MGTIINLCKPSEYYFIFSIFGLVTILTFNILSGVRCGVVTNIYLFFTQLLYIVFWCWVLNLICHNGYTKLSWFLFLLPIVTSSIVITLIAITSLVGEKIYYKLEDEKAKEMERDKKRNVESMIVL